MQAKAFEVFDRGTRYYIMAIKHEGQTPKENWLLEQAGLGQGTGYPIQLTDLESGKTERDAFKWRNHVSESKLFDLHLYLNQNFDNHPTGAVLDLEVIRGEVAIPKTSSFTANER